MTKGEVRLKLIRSKNEGKLFAVASQAELQKFYEQIQIGSADIKPVALLVDGGEGGGLIGEFLLGSAQAIGPAVATAMDAWFRGKAGRRLALKVDDIDIEAGSVLELHLMLLRVIASKDGAVSTIGPETKA